MRCDIGDRLTLKAKATKAEDGKPVDPDNCYWKVVPVEGSEEDIATVEAVRVEEGLFTGTYSPTISGRHLVLFHGTGENAAAEETSFVVRVPRVPRGA